MHLNNPDVAFRVYRTHDDTDPVHYRGTLELLEGGTLRIDQDDEPLLLIGPTGWVRIEGVIDNND
jgi:hypothetical protein